ncbi:hypothetical protein GN244_ATG13018 [Phytophthora infestans]|uniref:Uncharacterized protein n=1 Tax=Phytophthora infestans TaxID=4787 RepID=A0A833WRY1_PHYIN|nr:hypothetical protein GN244_ATG13018 [Phytophthora infestans]KAF4143464.1 hypothetical protein GN958_ATG07197 [Phytophthora infestans]
MEALVTTSSRNWHFTSEERHLSLDDPLEQEIGYGLLRGDDKWLGFSDCSVVCVDTLALRE